MHPAEGGGPSGQPAAAPDRIILNVDEPEVWLDERLKKIVTLAS